MVGSGAGFRDLKCFAEFREDYGSQNCSLDLNAVLLVGPQGKKCDLSEFIQFDLPFGQAWAWQRAISRNSLEPQECIGCHAVTGVPLVCLLQRATMV